MKAIKSYQILQSLFSISTTSASTFRCNCFVQFRTITRNFGGAAPTPAAEALNLKLKPSIKKMNCADRNSRNWAVLRYNGNSNAAGAPAASAADDVENDRFKLTICYKSKQFNFNRHITETPSSCIERIKSNFMKKFGPTKLGFTSTDEANNLPISFEGIDQSTEFRSILEQTEPNQNLQLKLFDELINIDFNPPEVIGVKFLKAHRIGYPIVPIKFETTPSFSIKDSKYYWEAAPKLSGNPDKWTLVSESLVFTPSLNEAGMFLKLSIVPSDGKRFGPPVTIDIPGVVGKSKASPTANDPILFYEERRSHLEPKTKDTIRIISYNILSEELTTPEWFTKSPKESLDIEYRLPLLNAELGAYDGDIYCFQEMDQKHFDANYTIYLSNPDHLGLQGLFSCKSGNIHEGLATFFNPRKFKLIDSYSTVDLKKAMQKLPFYTTLCQDEGLKSLVATLDGRGNVLQIVLLESIDNPGNLLLVANTHLYWKPEGDHVRLLQTITSVTTIENLVQSYESKYPGSSITTIFCGDFNCTPPYSSVRLLETGTIQENDFDWTSHSTEKVNPGLNFSHNLKFSSAFPNQEITCIMGNFEGCIDYIWYQKDKLNLKAAYPPPSKETYEIISLPNFSAPSDHLPLIADFTLQII